ncbi:hypothetical protein D3C86_1924060 [compost metagenome]
MFTVNLNYAVVVTQEFGDKIKTDAKAGDVFSREILYPLEALKQFFLICFCNSDALVLDKDFHF